jgi:hypothetical protein
LLPPSSGWRPQIPELYLWLSSPCSYSHPIRRYITYAVETMSYLSLNESMIFYVSVVLSQKTQRFASRDIISSAAENSNYKFYFQVYVFWVVTPCSIVVGYQRFKCPYCLQIQCVPLKCWYPTTTPQGVTTQKTSIWNITAMKNLKSGNFILFPSINKKSQHTNWNFSTICYGHTDYLDVGLQFI